MLAIFSAHVIGAQERETVPLKPKYRTLRLIITAECISPRANRSTPLPMHGTASASPSPSDATRAPWDGGRERIPGTWEPPPSPPTVGRADGRGGGGPNNRSPAAEGGCGGRHAAGGCDADAPACHARGSEGGGGGTVDAGRSVVHHQYAKRFF